MRKIISMLLIITMVFGIVSINVAFSASAEVENTTSLQAVRDKMNLAWSDEFDGETIDQTKWSYEGSSHHRNGEAQVYADNDEDHNAWLEDGNLVIEARKEERIGYVSGVEKQYHYTSACLRTDTKFDFKYGIAEARLKIPADLSLWPAFWTCGYDDELKINDWPRTGEIDIMENFAKNNSNTTATLHYQPKGYTGTSKTATGVGSWSNSTMSTEFHTYGIYWTPTFMSVFVDDYILGIVDITDHDKFFAFQDFKHFFLLNIAVGNMNGTDIASDFVSDKMYVDYVRVYQPEDGDYSGTTTIETEKCNYNADSSGITTTSSSTSLSFTSYGKDKFARFTLPNVKEGTYKVFYQTRSGVDTSTYRTQFNGVKVGEDQKFSDSNNQGQHYVGTVKLQTDSDINVCMTSMIAGTTNMAIDKVILISTFDDEAIDIPYLDMDNAEPKTVEISSYSDWIDKIGNVFENDTIKLTDDIIYETPADNYTFYQQSVNNLTIDMNGHMISDGNYENIKTATSVTNFMGVTWKRSRIFYIPANYNFKVVDNSETKGGMLSCFTVTGDGDPNAVATLGTRSGSSTATFSDVDFLNLNADTNGRDAVVRMYNINADFKNCGFYTLYHYGLTGNTADAGIRVFAGTNAAQNTISFENCDFETTSTALSIEGINKIVNVNNCRFNTLKNYGVSNTAENVTINVNNTNFNNKSNGTGVSNRKLNSVINLTNNLDSITVKNTNYIPGINVANNGVDCSAGSVILNNIDVAAKYGVVARGTGEIEINNSNIKTNNTLTTTASKIYAPLYAYDTGKIVVNGGEYGAIDGGNTQAIVYLPVATASVVLRVGHFSSASQFAISANTTVADATNPVTGKSYYDMTNSNCVSIASDCIAAIDEDFEQEVTENLKYSTNLYVKENVNALLGDANNDGVIDTKDVLILRKLMAGYSVDYDTILSDTNKDNVVSLKDLLYVRKYLSK